MTTAVDTNVIVSLWYPDSKLNSAARLSLDDAYGQGPVVISGPVFSELLAAPSRDENFVNSFVQETGLIVDWMLSEQMWRVAGRAFQLYSVRRKLHRSSGPRRILADFLIGAHALNAGHRFLTLDAGFYKIAFPGLKLVPV
jgi:hypothetical protein